MLQISGSDSSYLRGPRRTTSGALRALRVVDLFSGCGGLTLGVEAAATDLGMALDVRLVAERDRNVAAVFADNFRISAHRMFSCVEDCFDQRTGASLSTREQRARSLAGPDIDVLVGGPPCQGHSTLNNYTRGDDPKNALYLSMVRAAQVLSPHALLIENVPAVERDRAGVVERARELLEGLGYRTDTAIVSTIDIGVPQRRKRHVLLALGKGSPDIQAAVRDARLSRPRDLSWAIKDLVGRSQSHLDEPGLLSAANRKRAEYLLKNDEYDLPNRYRPACQRGPHKYKSMYGRLRWDEPAQTITSGFGSPGQGRYLHPELARTITPHEAARLQFFPDWFSFERLRTRRELARAIGNAVPPKLSFVLTHHVFNDAAAVARPNHVVPQASRYETGSGPRPSASARACSVVGAPPVAR